MPVFDLLSSASILFGQFKTDTARGRSRSRDTPDPSGGGDKPDSNSPHTSSSRHHTSFNPNQTRGRDGRWIETGHHSQADKKSGGDDNLFDPDSAIGRAYKKQQEEELARKAQKPVKKELPKDVTSEDLGRGGTYYSHDTKSGNKLEVIISPVADGSSKNVDFTINGSMDKTENLSTEESNRISIKIAKIMQFDASQREDGEKYQTSAYTDDSEEYGAVRAYAYEKIAKFSRPMGGDPGGNQYAIVKNGKLEPDIKRVEAEEREEQMPPVYVKENTEAYRRTAEEYRKNQKANK